MHFLRGSVGIPRAEANREWPVKHRAPPRPLISLGIAEHRGVFDKGARIDSIYRGVWGIAKIDTPASGREYHVPRPTKGG